MRLELQLERVRELCDLPGLVAALGFEPLWEPVPLEAWLPDHGANSSEAALVGRQEGFRWFALKVPDISLARPLAHRLLRRGEHAGLLVHRPGGGLAVTVSFGECPAVCLEPSKPNPSAILILRRIQGVCRRASSPLAIAAAVAACLECSDITQAFFRDFRAILHKMASSLTGRVSSANRVPLALLQLTRVLFLYFVQARGWLDGRTGFLAEEVDHCLRQGRQVHRHFLAPLFFGLLNRPMAQRTSGIRRFGRIPFLNGGLFEPHPHERTWRGNVPNPVWRDAFDRLFERYHFTADESRREGYIAPDMLGRVFEGLMAPEERHTTGTFYTPPSLVRTMVRRAFQALVERRFRVQSSVAERMLDDADPMLLPAWSGLTILDPAVGSGAFLLGAMDQLDGLRRREIRSRSARRRRILEQNLFGVDLNPAAVRLTELRLWLAVIAEEDEGPTASIDPLPNLDCLIRQGDSLTDPFALASRLPGSIHTAALEVARLRRRVVVTPGSGKQEAVRQLRQAEASTAKSCLIAAEVAVEGEISDLLALGRSPDLFGRHRGLDREGRRRLAVLRDRRRGLASARRHLAREGMVPWFHYQAHFPDIFAGRGGFDVTIGNPPWVRAEQLRPEMRRHLSARYPWWGSNPDGHGYRHLPDLGVAFLQRAVELTAPDGVVALLLPAKVATAGYGGRARAGMVRETTLHTVADLSDQSTEFAAAVYPMALIAAKGQSSSRKKAVVRTSLANSSPALPVEQFSAAPWILLPSLHRTVRHLLRRWSAIAASLPIHIGVKTGANRVFLDPPDEIEPELLRWAVRGRDVRMCRVRCHKRILWTHGPDGRPLQKLPPRAAAWLARQLTLLERRADFRRGQIWQLFRTGPATALNRVIWADLARRLVAAPLIASEGQNYVPLNTCYLIVLPHARAALAMAAWLNSTWVRALARLTADRARGSHARYNARVVGGVPLPPGVLRDAGLARLARDAASDRLDQESLDQRVADHLELAPADRRALARLR